jgi:transposase InsO family protein
LVVVCHFTRRVVLIPLPNIEAATVAHAIFDNIICEYGTPSRMVMDRGATWLSGLFQAFAARCPFTCKLSTARHPQTDGATERVNKTVVERLRALVNFAQSNWDQLLKPIQFALNSSHHATIGMAPFKAHLGYMPAAPGLDAAPSDILHGDRLAHLSRIWRAVQNTTTKAKAAQAVQANRHRRDLSFKP